MNNYAHLIADAASKIKQGKYFTAFTGAGISVESGIPSFRGKEGLWSRYDPKFVEIDYFRAHPGECWTVLAKIFYEQVLSARPNPAHEVLARWESRGLLKAIVTQNIDNLHYIAGNQKVIEYHGTTRTLECLLCKSIKLATQSVLRELPPKCQCGGIMKPSFVFFGEEIPADAAHAAVQEALVSDVMLVIGTTGTVMPANMIPLYASRSGAFIIEINPEPGEFTHSIVDLYLPLKASEALLHLEQAINQSAG